MVFDGYSGYQMTVLEYHISIDDHQVANKNESVVDGRDVNHGEINRKDGYCEIG